MPSKVHTFFNKPGRLISGLGGIFAVLLLWYMASNWGWLGKTLLASPQEVLSTIGQAFAPEAKKSEQFHVHALNTILLTIKGWSIAVLIGIVVGLLLGSVYVAFRTSEPIIEFFRAIPPILAFPLFLVAFNYGIEAYIWTIVFGCLPVMILTVSRGAQQISLQAIEIMKINRVNKLLIGIASGIEILPSIFLGARITFSFALIIAVVTEMVFTPREGWAIGSLARDSEINFDTPMFYTCVLSIGLFGYMVNILLKKIEGFLGFIDTDKSLK